MMGRAVENVDYDELETYFLMHEHTWKFKEGLKVPVPGDLKAVVDKAAQMLYDTDSAEGSILEVGGLVIMRTRDGYDVFAYFGSGK